MAVSRKTVTVLFADVADSTALGERMDPETLRGALARWFAEARAVIEHHGGTVEKYIGDSVMAVFGVPQLHEDDAVRAVRAAKELTDVLSQLNEQLERELGLRFTVRIGVNTGEVVTGDDGGTLVTGDAVNVAKRFEEAGDGGDVIVGDTTHALARTAGEFEPLAPLAVKGKSARLRAWRLLSVDRDGVPFERRFDTPLVGRRRELEQLGRAFRRSVEERTCHLFTLLGNAGIGKTRLASELFGELAAEATILRGRCLPYGDGITFWPLHDVIRALGGEDEVLRLLAGNDDAELVCERLTGEPGSQELFWAVRRLCETLGRVQPLVLCFEDVHWAEPKFLDLIEYLAGWIRDTPMLLLCIARPEFLDERPAWLSGQENAASLTLSPLSAAESRQLLGALGVRGEPGERIAAAVEGNPLYAEQMAAMVAEGGSVDTIPPTIHALLAARLDRLSPAERQVIERAAVAGKEFWRDAVVALGASEREADTSSVLMSLVRKELIRPERSTDRPDDAFRFGHVLIRDAAYAAIPKETRASLHEQFAAWLESESAAPDLDELVGYHLEQAYRNRDALGRVDEHARTLAERAAVVLGRAGQRAMRRGDVPAAVRLLERAAALLPPEDPLSGELLLELGTALRRAGRFADAGARLEEAARRADDAADRRLRCHAALEQAHLRSYMQPEGGTEELLRVANSVIPAFEELGDSAGLVRAWVLIAEAHWYRCRIRPMEEALEHALRHVQPESRHAQLAIWNAMARAALAGPLPVPDAIRRCEEIEGEAPADRSLQAVIASVQAYLEAMRGRFEAARELYAASHDTLAELGQVAARAALQTWSGAIELLAGDAAAAEAELRAAFGTLEPIGDRQNLATIAASLAAALHAQNRDDEAIEFTQLSEKLASDDDATSQIEWRAVRAKILADDGRSTDAERLARESVLLARETDCPNLHGNALLSLGETLARAERVDEAAEALSEARDAYAAKGNVVMAARAAEQIDAPTTAVTSQDGR